MNEEDSPGSELGQQPQSYSVTERRFAELELSSLTFRWIEVTRDWLRSSGNAHLLEMEDLTTEFLLRGLQPPYEMVSGEAAAVIQSEVLAAEPTAEQIRDELLRFKAKQSIA